VWLPLHARFVTVALYPIGAATAGARVLTPPLARRVVCQGLTLGADSTPFGDEGLDEEGRCIITEHDTFMLFNVYTPNDSTGGKRLPYKLRFLDALRCLFDPPESPLRWHRILIILRSRARMDAARKDKGKAVILAGDLNMCRRASDMDWCSRMVNVEELIRSTIGMGGAEGDEGTVAKIGTELCGWWGEMRRR